MWLRGHEHPLIKYQVRRTPSPLLEAARACEIRQNAPHQLGANSKEMRPVVPTHLSDIDQPQIDFVDECRGLESVTGTFSGHVVPRRPVQFLVHQRHKFLQRLLISGAPGPEQAGDLMWRGCQHTTLCDLSS